MRTFSRKIDLLAFENYLKVTEEHKISENYKKMFLGSCKSILLYDFDIFEIECNINKLHTLLNLKFKDDSQKNEFISDIINICKYSFVPFPLVEMAYLDYVCQISINYLYGYEDDFVARHNVSLRISALFNIKESDISYKDQDHFDADYGYLVYKNKNYSTE